jgi:predicted DNA-binding ribbon-helix-helix protein
MIKVVKSFSLEPKVFKALEQKAKQQDRSVSWLVNEILKKELEQC